MVIMRQIIAKKANLSINNTLSRNIPITPLLKAYYLDNTLAYSLERYILGRIYSFIAPTMFDITSFVRERIFRRPKLVPTLAGEELSEKQTTKLGYFLLYCMFASILVSAQWTLSIINEIPTPPNSVPSCVYNMASAFDVEKSYDSYYYMSDYGTCNLVSVDPKFDFTQEYNTLKVPYDEIRGYREKIQTLQSEKNQLEYKERNSQDDYNTSLQEKTARENSGLYDTKGIQDAIKTSRANTQSLDTQIASFTGKVKEIQSQYKPQVESLERKIDTAEADYRTAYMLYRFYIAILSLVFAAIVFTVLYRMYVKQKLRNSPHAVIFSVATFAYGLVLLQIMVLFVWDIIPHRLLGYIMALFELFTPLVYIVQFLWPIIIIAVFGFLVYRIQKRLYSPENVLKRFITDKKCPNCGNGVDFTKPYCPLCAHEIQVKCPKCQALTVKGMPHCSSCGETLPKKDIISYGKEEVSGSDTKKGGGAKEIVS